MPKPQSTKKRPKSKIVQKEYDDSGLPKIKVGDLREETRTVVDIDYDEEAKELFISHAMDLIHGVERPAPEIEIDDRLLEIGFLDIIVKAIDDRDQWSTRTPKKEKKVVRKRKSKKNSS